MERVPTGIQRLDDLINGYPKNKTILISGTAGAGKTILGLHYVVAACERGQKAVYFCTEEPAADIRMQAMSFGWDLENYERSNSSCRSWSKTSSSYQFQTQTHVTCCR